MDVKYRFDIETAVNDLFQGKFDVDQAIRFIEEKIIGHHSLRSSIVGQLNFAISEYHTRIYKKEKRASVYVDPEEKYQRKTPESIIEKLWRNSNEYTLDNFLETMEDIIRFRILCNYLCDVEEMRKILPGEMKRRFNYKMRGEPKDFINMDPEKRKKGHRALHIVFQAEWNERKYMFEVQVMTLLQNAWDRKDHSIVYELERIGEVVPLATRMRSYAMSEMLYVADDYFNELLLKKERGGE